MKSYSLSHLSDQTLLNGLRTLVARDRITTAEMLAHIAEVDARKLYLPAAYPSMLVYCVGELELSEEAARKRIHAARVARDFPAVFEAIADGRLHLSAVVLLAAHLSPENAADLLSAAAHKTREEIRLMLAERFPRSEAIPLIEAVPASSARQDSFQVERAPGRVDAAVPSSKVTPLAPRRFALQVTIGEETHEKLQHARELLSHVVAPSDLAGALDRVLDLAIRQLEKGKFAATERPRGGRDRLASTGARHISAEVKRVVWQRDGGRCTYVSRSGHRCGCRNRVEFDHVTEVARGGLATVDNLRLRCRAHNQYTAERTFGVGFMNEKRDEARQVRGTNDVSRSKVGESGRTDPAEDVTPWLRALGYKPDEARRAASACAGMVDQTLEERVRFALATLAPPHRKMSCVGASG